MNKKNFLEVAEATSNYEAPYMEVVEIKAERGFEISGSTEDYEEGEFEW